MDGWTIHIEAAGTEPADLDPGIEELMELMIDHGGAINARTDGTRYGATFSLYRNIAAREAATEGEQLFIELCTKAGLPGWEIVRLEIMTFAEHEAELARPNFPELVGVAELAAILDVSQQRASQIQTKADFPRPVAVLRSGPVWTRPSINNFLKTWTRKGGRPKKRSDF